jgi:hypothetical protein
VIITTVEDEQGHLEVGQEVEWIAFRLGLLKVHTRHHEYDGVEARLDRRHQPAEVLPEPGKYATVWYGGWPRLGERGRR